MNEPAERNDDAKCNAENQNHSGDSGKEAKMSPSKVVLGEQGDSSAFGRILWPAMVSTRVP